jgi:GTP-binding protein
MNKLNYQQAKFLLSVADIKQLPSDEGAEVAFIGRSNAGKSSALNVLTRQKNLARTSKTPGRTQLINFFVLDDQRYLVDLPGYGYAKVSQKTKADWQKLVDLYLKKRESLSGLVLLMDIRHPLRDYDKQVLLWAKQVNLPVHILLTKADKLSRGAGIRVLYQVQKEIAELKDIVTVQIFSSLKKIGREELEQKLDLWLDYNLIEKSERAGD